MPERAPFQPAWAAATTRATGSAISTGAQSAARAPQARPRAAVTTASRAEVLPELPSIGEFVPGYEASQWYGVGAPKNTPAEVVARLNAEINAALADPKMNGLFADVGGAVLPGSPADFGKLLADETEKWGKVIRTANIKAE